MDEEKKDLNQNDSEFDVVFTQAKSLFAKPEQEPEKAPVVENKPDKKETKKQQRKAEREKRNKKYPDKLSFMLGLVVLIFAVLGIVLTVWNSVRYIKSTTDTGSEYAQYNEYLTPIAAVDPDPFDDIVAADQEQLLYASIWSILSKESTPDTYSYSGGYMLIPAADVENAYMSIFGPETASSLTHMTVQGYNSIFEYNVAGAVYKIPVTTISPVYTPRVTEVTKSGTALVVTVEFLASESWSKDSEGNFIPPEPDKVMKITLREYQGRYFIGAVQTASSTVPETMTFDQTPTEPTSGTTQEPTTSGGAEKTTLGGRV